MSELVARSIKDTQTASGRTVFRLTAEEWDIIDRVAAFEGVSWRDWVGRVVDVSRDSANVTKAAGIRQRAIAAFNEMLDKQAASDFERLNSGEVWESEPSPEHPLAKRILSVSDNELADELVRAKPLAALDGTAFVLHLGTWHGVPALLIENRLRGGDHYVYVNADVE
jgi:hypothetical protein